jgi:MFS family permease
MLSLCGALFLAALDITIITTALPTITETFQSSAGYTWIGSAYLLACASSTPSWGKISDIWGRKPILLLAAGIFFIGSTLAGTSVSIAMLIIARAVQGLGAGGLIVLVNICVSDLFSPRKRGKYLGIVGLVWALAAGTGPILGGVFTEKVSWRWCFYINCELRSLPYLYVTLCGRSFVLYPNANPCYVVPITGTVFILLFIFLHLDNPKTPVWDGLKAVDWAGSLAVVGATLMILLGLEFGGVTYPWSSATVICLIIFGVLTALLFLLNEWKFARYPVMPLRIFKHRSSIAALGVCFCHGFIFISGSYYLPLYFQAVLGATPLLSGVYLLPYALSFSFTSTFAGVLIKRTGKYLPALWFGFIVTTLGWGLFIDLPFDPSWAKIILYQIVAGLGVGPNFLAPVLALQAIVKPSDIATATATLFFTRNLSTTISVVIGGVVFQNEMQKRYPSLVADLGVDIANALSGGSAGSSVGIVAQLPDAQREIARMAFFQSLRVMWIMYVAFAGLGVCVSALVGSQKLSEDHTVTKTGLGEEEKKRREELENRKNRKKMNEVGNGEGMPKEQV